MKKLAWLIGLAWLYTPWKDEVLGIMTGVAGREAVPVWLSCRAVCLWISSLFWINHLSCHAAVYGYGLPIDEVVFLIAEE